MRELSRPALIWFVVCMTIYNTIFLLAFFARLDDTCPMVAMPSASGLWTCRMPFAWPCAFRARLHYRSTGALPPDHCGSGFIPWSASSSAACPQVWWSRSQRSRRHTLRPLGALVSWWLISAFRSALRFLRATLPLYPSKNESGKEKVKFFDLYQALTEVEPRGGKEKGSVKVFGRGMVKVLPQLKTQNSKLMIARGPCSVVRRSHICCQPPTVEH